MKPKAAPRPTQILRFLAAVPALAVLPLVTADNVSAVDGTADVRQSEQHARSELGAFRTYWRRESLSVRQTVPLATRLALDVRFRTLRETSGGDASGLSQETVRTTRQPDLSLNYRTHPFNAGIKTSWFEQDLSGSGQLSSEGTRRQHSAWMNLRLSSGTRLSSTATRTDADETSLTGDVTDSRQTSGSVLAEQQMRGSWSSQYRFSGLSSDITRLGSHRDQTSHALELQGAPRFADNRVSTSLRVRSAVFDQKLRVDTGDEFVRYDAPLAGGVTFDDTPEERDPLEGAVTSVPALFDGDRTEPTSVNIGDSAPAVREFGGDYRNIEFDFGETVLPVEGTLYVSEPVVHPELFQWRVFVSDEPEGRLWEELTTNRFSVRYGEFGTILQGWEFTFGSDVSGRYIKLVDVKSGATIPDLHVTELEISTRTLTGVDESTDRTLDHHLDASVMYDVSRAVRVGYQTGLRRRDRQDSDQGDLTSIAHTFTSRWMEGAYRVAAQLDLHTLSSRTRRSTDVITYGLSASRGTSARDAATASWTRSSDRSAGQDRTTDTYALTAFYRPAPRLQVSHRLSHGRRDDREYDIRSRSIAITHTVRSNPWSSLMVNLDRSDRWVNQAAGAGFERFHDTGMDVVWSPAPRVSASSDLRMQGRRETEWSSRQAVTWSPLPGSRLETHISGNSFYDSRTRVRRWGSDVLVKWKPRRELILEGGVGAQRYEVGGVRNTPIDTFVRAGLSF